MTNIQPLDARFPTRVAFLRVTLAIFVCLLSLASAQAQTTQPAKTALFFPIIDTLSVEQANAVQSQLDKLAGKYTQAAANAQIRIKLVTSDGKPLPPQAHTLVFVREAYTSPAPCAPLTPESLESWTASVPPGHYAVTAYAPGYIADLKGPFFATPSQNPEPHLITLTPLPLTTIRFVDDQGKPIKPDSARLSSSITPYAVFPGIDLHWYPPSPLLTPEPDGSFRIFTDSTFGPSIKVFSRGHQCQWLSLSDSAAKATPGNLTITLAKSSSITGRVLDAQTGQPIKNAAIHRSTFYPQDHSDPGVTTDAQGAFAFDMLSDALPAKAATRPSKGTIQSTFTVTAAGYAPENFHAAQTGPLPNDIRLTTTRATTITVTGDLTQLLGYPHNPYLRAKTHAGFTDIPLTINGKTATGAGVLFARTKSALEFCLRTSNDLGVQFKDGQDIPQDIAIHIPGKNETRNVRITVRGIAAKDLPGLRLQINSHPGFSTPVALNAVKTSVTLDAQGSATLPLPLGIYLTFATPGYQLSSQASTMVIPGAGPNPAPMEMEFQTQPDRNAGAVMGKVFDEEDNPIPAYVASLSSDTYDFRSNDCRAFGASTGFALTNVELGQRCTLLIHLPDRPRPIPCADIKLTPFCPILELKVVLMKDGTVRLTPARVPLTDVSHNPGKLAIQIGLFTGPNPVTNLHNAITMAETLKREGLNLHTFQNRLTGDAIVLLGSIGHDYAMGPQSGPDPNLAFLHLADKLRQKFPLMSINSQTPGPNAPPSVIITIPRFGPYILPTDLYE
jgi:hypothetical protein